jgi:hypothetical protein
VWTKQHYKFLWSSFTVVDVMGEHCAWNCPFKHSQRYDSFCLFWITVLPEKDFSVGRIFGNAHLIVGLV